MPATLTQQLDEAWSQAGNPPLCVAFSGGRDSSVLLHAMAAVRGPDRRLRALHVDHGLHADSAAWAAACAATCKSLGVPLETRKVSVTLQGEGPEGAARQARHDAFAGALHENEWLVTAHHRDDQAETVLLKLLRGAGPHGLGGMRALRPLGRGQLWRPLLDMPRDVLTAYAQSNGLSLIDDPANRDPDMARSYLRHEIMPLLQRHWPHVAQSLAHAAQLQQAQADLIDRQARAALEDLRDIDDSLQALGWTSTHPALHARILELWLHPRGLPAPTRAQREELERQVREAAPGRVPRIAWPGAEIRLWRGRLYAMAPLPAASDACSMRWQGGELALPAGAVRWDPATPDHPEPPSLEVRMDVRGLRFRPSGDRHTRSLAHLFQQAGVPPWQRRFCPILYDGDGSLLAVADLWTTEAGEALFDTAGLRPCWIRPG